jgi:hypothetical protein
MEIRYKRWGLRDYLGGGDPREYGVVLRAMRTIWKR